MSVARAQEEISSPEFTEWIAYQQIDPFGNDRADLRNGILCSTVVNLIAKKPTKPRDFMPEFGDDKPQGRTVLRSPAHIEHKLRTMFPRKSDG